MSGPLAFLVAEIMGAIRRRAVVYALMACAGLIVVFAAGYGLDAVHGLLLFRLGPIAASLVVAAGLLVLAGICVGVAMFTTRAPSRSVRPVPLSTAPLVRPYPFRRIRTVVAAAAGAASAGVGVVGFVRMRRGRKATVPKRRSLFSAN